MPHRSTVCRDGRHREGAKAMDGKDRVEVSKGGLALAQHIAPVYFDNPKVRVVMVGGSVSRGRADQYSDLEIGVFWAEPPCDEERKLVIQRAGADRWSFEPYTAVSEWGAGEHWGMSEVVIDSRRYTGTSMISVSHLTVVAMDKCLKDVVEGYDTSLGKQSLIAAVQHGIPLYGQEALETWQQKAAYPDELARRMVRENLWFGPWFNPEAYLARDDLLVLYQHFIWLEQGLLKVLAGLNRIYYPSSEHKWLERLIDEMRVAPPNLSSRMKGIFRADPTSGWRQLKELIDETVLLVEAHMPEVDLVSPGDAHPQVKTAWAKRRWEPHAPDSLLRNIGAARAGGA
jgi:hypothetical protein